MFSWTNIKTYLLVTLVTLLIWAWAEAESLSVVPVSPRVEISGQGTDVAATVVDPGYTGTVRMRVLGSSAAVSQAQSRLSGGLRLTPGIGGVPAEPGLHIVDVREALRQHPLIANLGVNLLDVEPAALNVRIDEMAVKTIPVVPALRGLDLEGEPTCDPREVRVRVRKEALETLGDGVTAFATPTIAELSRLSGDGPHTVPANVTLLNVPAGTGPVTVEPTQVRVTFSLRGRSESWTASQVAVWVVMPPPPPGTSGKWTATPAQNVIASVTVSGPREQVAALREGVGGLVLRGYVVLSDSDLKAGTIDAPVRFALVPNDLTFTPSQSSVKVTIAPVKGE